MKVEAPFFIVVSNPVVENVPANFGQAFHALGSMWIHIIGVIVRRNVDGLDTI